MWQAGSGADVWAVDASPEALIWAQHNVSIQEANVQVMADLRSRFQEQLQLIITGF